MTTFISLPGLRGVNIDVDQLTERPVAVLNEGALSHSRCRVNIASSRQPRAKSANVVFASRSVAAERFVRNRQRGTNIVGSEASSCVRVAE
jgi:hypothetical protein